MIVVLAIDALELELVERFNCANLKQAHYGRTDISEFSEPRTMVLWSSFMTGKNKEQEVLARGDKEMWNIKWPVQDTFFSRFKDPLVLDLPGFSYDLAVHERSRVLLKKFFDAKTLEEKEKVRKAYNQDALEHHRKIKEEFLKALEEDHDLLLGYFSAADVIGHLNFGNTMLMRMVYKDLDEIAQKVREKGCPLIVLSDHGMRGVGMFGDHSEHGFWSTSSKNLGTPKITDFADILTDLKEQD
ncbi:MAG: alkaline phosphatase family protein [Candidatus Aenigmatarchaeota archaeon]